MAWTTPPTLTDGQVLTGAHTQIWRDDLNATAPALATTAGRIFVATGTNAIAERAINGGVVTTSETTTNTSFVDLTTVGPAVNSITTGVNALVMITSELANNTVGAFSVAAYAVSGATTSAATTDKGIWLRAATANQGIRCSTVHLETGLTAGSNSFTMKYAMTGGGGTAEFQQRRIAVIAL